MVGSAAKDDPWDMSSSPVIAPLQYIECDVPDGMTLAEWRRRDASPQGPRPVRSFTRRARSVLTRAGAQPSRQTALDAGGLAA
jgi:hypothetical protein